MGKNAYIVFIVILVAILGFWYYSSQQSANDSDNTNQEKMMEDDTNKMDKEDDSMMEDDDSMVEINALPTEPGILSGGITLQDGNNQLLNVQADEVVDLSTSSDEVKEVTMTSYYTMSDGKPYPRYSTKEITVKKGDKVKINLTVTAGTHDFNIDEYNIHQETPLDEQVTIEFTADQVGEFAYYCSMPNHRMNGHWGILKVVE